MVNARIPNDLLDRPAPEGARWLALAQLRRLIRAQRHLTKRGGAEALHDFRVALRRFRSVARAYHPILDDSISGECRRRLSAVARTAGRSRDADARLLLLHAMRAQLHGVDEAGIVWVHRQLARDRRSGDRALQRELALHFAGCAGHLQRRLMRYRVRLSGEERTPIPRMRSVMSQVLHEMSSQLRERLDAPKHAGEVRTLHLARIAAKRLRYSMEVLAEERIVTRRVARIAESAVTELTRLQDALGEINDAHSFRIWLRQRAHETSPRRIREVDLRRLQHLLNERATLAYSVCFEPAARRRVARMLRSVNAAARDLR